MNLEPCIPLNLNELKLMPGYLLVSRDKQEKSEGGIILTSIKQEKRLSHTGTILSVAECRAADNKDGVRIVYNSEPMPFDTGERVVFRGYAGFEVKLKDLDDVCYIMDEEDVLAVIDDSDEKNS